MDTDRDGGNSQLKAMHPIHAPPATAAVLSDPHLLWAVFEHLDDADLRPLSYMPEFLSLVRDPVFVRSRRRLLSLRARQRLSSNSNGHDSGHARALNVRRPSIDSLVHRNLIQGGMVTLRLSGDGHPVWGPEHRARCDVAIKLAQFLTRRMLATRLNKRAMPETLVQKNILVGVPTHATSPTKPSTSTSASTSHRAVASAIAARTLVAPRARLLMEQTRSRLARKLRDRPSMSEVVNSGLVPAHLVVPAARFGTGSGSETLVNNGCYLPLLTQQVALNNFLKLRKLKSKIAARQVGDRFLQPNLVSIDMNRVVEEMNLFLLARLKPSEMAERRMLRDWDLAALVCPPDVRDKIRFWEDLVAVSAD